MTTEQTQPARQLFDEREARVTQLTDPPVRTFVDPDPDRVPVGRTTLTRELSTVPWILLDPSFSVIDSHHLLLRNPDLRLATRTPGDRVSACSPSTLAVR